MVDETKCLELDCGRPYDHLYAWLADELSLRYSDESWAYESEGACCSVTIQPLEARRVSGLELQRTKLIVRGEQKALDSFMRLFTLRFISAGG